MLSIFKVNCHWSLSCFNSSCYNFWWKQIEINEFLCWYKIEEEAGFYLVPRTACLASYCIIPFHVTWFCLWKCIFVLYHGLFFYGVTNQVQLKELYNFNQPVACFEKIQSSRGTKFIVYSDSFSEVWMFLTVSSWLYLQWNRYSIFDRSSS